VRGVDGQRGGPTGGGRGRSAKNGEAADARGDSEKKGSTSIWGTDSTPEICGRASGSRTRYGLPLQSSKSSNPLQIRIREEIQGTVALRIVLERLQQ
jgi:hypothetical protein